MSKEREPNEKTGFVPFSILSSSYSTSSSYQSISSSFDIPPLSSASYNNFVTAKENQDNDINNNNINNNIQLINVNSVVFPNNRKLSKYIVVLSLSFFHSCFYFFNKYFQVPSKYDIQEIIDWHLFNGGLNLELPQVMKKKKTKRRI